jgi:Flp pilus assembly protein TadG
MKRRRRPTRALLPKWAESGQAIVWVAVMLPLFLSAVGLSLDGGTVFAARRELQNVADAAARAGAAQLDVRAYRESGGTTVVLDVPRARQAAAEHLARRGGTISGTVDARPRRVVVEASIEVPLGFIALAGIRTARVTATAPAELRHGVEMGNR